MHFIMSEVIHGECNSLCVMVLYLIEKYLLIFFFKKKIPSNQHIHLDSSEGGEQEINSFSIFKVNSSALASLKSLNLIDFEGLS